MAESAEPDDADLLPRPDLEPLERRIRRDPCAEQRSNAREVAIRRHLQRVVLVDDVVVRVTTVGLRHAIHLGAVVRKGALLEAELLLAALTTRTFATRIDKASDAGNVADLGFGDRIAELGNSAHHLVAGHERIIRLERILPFIFLLVNIGVANARE